MKSISALLCFVASITPSLAQISLGTAAPFGVIGVAGVTSNGVSNVNGSIGTTGKSVVGFPPGILTGTAASGTTVTQPRADAVTAYNTARALTSIATLSATITNITLTPGVYKFSKTAAINGTLTLNGAGQYVININSQLTTAVGSSVVLTNGAVATDVFWTAGSATVLGSGSTFQGSLVTDGLLTVGQGAVVNGGLYGGSLVTLNANTITAPAA